VSRRTGSSGCGDGAAPSRAAATPDPRVRGWKRVQLPIESVEHAVEELLRLGADVEVLEPSALRQRLAETARGLAALYG
jgi:predicted DNA-binding transcriptional regulator YafY